MQTELYRSKEFIQAVAIDMARLFKNQGDLSQLNGVEKSSLVAAFNELAGRIHTVELSTEINDGVTATNSAWSSSKVAGMFGDEVVARNAAINAAVQALSGVDANFLTTMQNLQTALANNTTFDQALAAVVNGAVRYDVAQSLTTAQKAQGRSNLGATSMDDVMGAYGDPDYSKVAFYQSSLSAAVAGTALPTI